MAILIDCRCKWCDSPFEAWSDRPACRFCGGTGERLFTTLHTPEWGGPRYCTSLMRSFDSRSEQDAYARSLSLVGEPIRDKYGGAYANNIEPRKDTATRTIYFDPRSPSSRSKGTAKRLDQRYQ